MEVLDFVNLIYKNGVSSYLLNKYVDRAWWIPALRKEFPNNHIDNITDFDYNKCFTMNINISNINASLGSMEYDKFILENGSLYTLIIEISAVSPYCLYKYLKYYLDDGNIKCVCNNDPFCAEHSYYNKKINDFIKNNNLTLVEDKTLMTEVAGVTLELKEPPVSVYNCLFQDTYSFFPYIEEGQI